MPEKAKILTEPPNILKAVDCQRHSGPIIFPKKSLALGCGIAFGNAELDGRSVIENFRQPWFHGSKRLKRCDRLGLFFFLP